TRAVPILVYEPEALITLSPGMAGTVKLRVPDPPGVADFVGDADLVATGDALCVAAAEVAGVTEGPEAVGSPDGEDGAGKAVAEPPAAADDAAVGEFPPSPAQAVCPQSMGAGCSAGRGVGDPGHEQGLAGRAVGHHHQVGTVERNHGRKHVPGGRLH